MAPSLASAWRSFWHTMTSNDRHASHNSPFRTGQHVALPHGRHDPLTSVITDRTDSRTDLADTGNAEIITPVGTPGTQSPTRPYSPGMRSQMQRTQSDEVNKSPARASAGEIQMQNFSDGLPPPPPVSHSWKRIERWAEDNYEELWDNMCEGCTQNDINELEHELDCQLPMEVRESLQVHDGQERGGMPTGLIFGNMILDCEEIVQEWKNWRRVNEEYLTQKPVVESQQIPIKAFDQPSSSTDPPPAPEQTTSAMWTEDLLARQDSQPSHAIQKAYAHPMWIPLARDWGGNCLAVDLAPGLAGKWGQVILMGRDYDCKYVVSRSWGAFLATLADDLSSTKVSINEESGELKLLEFKHQGVEPGYFDILRWRADQKWGRKFRPKKANGNPAPAMGRRSPYSSPTRSDADRRRSSPQRFQQAHQTSTGSPRGSVSSPLARVAEEMPPPISTKTATDPRKGSLPMSGKLVSPTTTPIREDVEPPFANGTSSSPTGKGPANGVGKENMPSSGLRMKGIEVDGEDDEEMKTVKI